MLDTLLIFALKFNCLYSNLLNLIMLCYFIPLLFSLGLTKIYPFHCFRLCRNQLFAKTLYLELFLLRFKVIKSHLNIEFRFLILFLL
jgi:hypothetical protein